MKHKFALLQWYRAVAAILILLYHFTGSVFGSFFRFGWAGVDLFFVLSGFIITYVHYNDLKQRSNLGLYIKKRLIRIYPVYWIVATIVLIGLTILDEKTISSYQIGPTSADGLLYLFKCYLLIPQQADYFVLQAWTLGYEMLFYVMFFIALALGFNKSRYLLLGWVALILANYLFIKATNPYLNMFTDPIILEFIMGALVAYFIRINGFKDIPNGMFFILLIVLLAALKLNAVYWLPADVKRNFAGILLLGLLSAVILIKLTWLNSKKNYRLGILGKIGEASYSFYLLHYLLLSIVLRILSKIVKYFSLQSNLIALYGLHLAAVIVIITAAYIAYLLIEAPVLAFCNRLFVKKGSS